MTRLFFGLAYLSCLACLACLACSSLACSDASYGPRPPDASGPADLGTRPDGASADFSTPRDGSGPGDSGAADQATTSAPLPYLGGVSEAGLEFGEGTVPGLLNTHYVSPTTASIDYFASRGMRVFRVPFLWERLQPTQYGDFDSAYFQLIRDLVTYITTTRAAYVVLDPHNYARYHGEIVGSASVPNAALADLWTRLSDAFGNEPRVLFALMNEPHTMPSEQWLSAANAAIAAIRSAGAGNLLLVPGNAWTGAHSWFQSWYGTPNAEVMLGVVDPLDHYAYELHQYLDATFAGTESACVSTTIGSEKLAPVTAWLRANGRRGFLGEINGGSHSTCFQAVDDALGHLDANRDVWLGFTMWAAGPWWGDYIFTLEPNGATESPMLQYVTPHL